MAALITLFLLPKTELYVLLLLCQQKTITNSQNLAKDLKNQCIGIIIKQKVGIKIQQISIDIFLNQTL